MSKTKLAIRAMKIPEAPACHGYWESPIIFLPSLSRGLSEGPDAPTPLAKIHQIPGGSRQAMGQVSHGSSPCFQHPVIAVVQLFMDVNNEPKS